MSLRVGYDHTQPLAHEVVGDLIHLMGVVDGRTRVLREGLDRIVERIREPGLEVRVHLRVTQDRLRWLAAGIEGAIEADHALGQGAGLVRAQHVHAAEVLDGVQSPHDHPPFRHLQGAVRESDADDRGQQFGGEAHGEGEGEEERVDERLPPEEVDRQDHHDHHQHDLGEQGSEPVDAAFELGFRRPQAQALRDLAEDRALAGPRDQDLRRPAAHARAHEHAVRPLGQTRARGHERRSFLHREGLAGEDRLIHEEVVRLKHHPVGRDEAPRGKQDHVARSYLCCGDHRWLSVAQHVRLDGDARAKLLHRVPGPVFLHETQQRAAEDHREDDGRVQPLPQHERDRRGEDQDEDERTPELVEEQAQGARAFALLDGVRSALDQSPLSVFLAKAVAGRAQRGEELVGRKTPVGRERRLRIDARGLHASECSATAGSDTSGRACRRVASAS